MGPSSAGPAGVKSTGAEPTTKETPAVLVLSEEGRRVRRNRLYQCRGQRPIKSGQLGTLEPALNGCHLQDREANLEYEKWVCKCF